MTIERREPAPITPEWGKQVSKVAELPITLRAFVLEIGKVLTTHPSLQIQLGRIHHSVEIFQIVFFDPKCITAADKSMYDANLKSLFKQLTQALHLLCASEYGPTRNAFNVAPQHLNGLIVTLVANHKNRVRGNFSIPHPMSCVIVSHGQTSQELLRIVIKDAEAMSPIPAPHTV